VCIIDTSIFMSILDVPGRNQYREKVGKDFEEFAGNNCTFILPMATIVETGNHIAQQGDGRVRRDTALRFVTAVKASFEEEPPWRTAEFPRTDEIITWIDGFPDMAGQNKKPDKYEGTSFGDFSIIQEFHKACKRFSMTEVFIWSLDQDLRAYHRP
jgi:hypothetical protein